MVSANARTKYPAAHRLAARCRRQSVNERVSVVSLAASVNNSIAESYSPRLCAAQPSCRRVSQISSGDSACAAAAASASVSLVLSWWTCCTSSRRAVRSSSSPGGNGTASSFSMSCVSCSSSARTLAARTELTRSAPDSARSTNASSCRVILSSSSPRASIERAAVARESSPIAGSGPAVAPAARSSSCFARCCCASAAACAGVAGAGRPCETTSAAATISSICHTGPGRIVQAGAASTANENKDGKGVFAYVWKRLHKLLLGLVPFERCGSQP